MVVATQQPVVAKHHITARRAALPFNVWNIYEHRVPADARRIIPSILYTAGGGRRGEGKKEDGAENAGRRTGRHGDDVPPLTLVWAWGEQ